MPASLKLLTAFEKGYVRNLHFDNNTELSPPTGTKWLLLSGRIAHVTATSTHLRTVWKVGSGLLTGAVKILIAAASATQSHNIFEGNPHIVDGDNTTLQNGFYVVHDDQKMILTGDASCTADIQVLEWYPEVI